MISRNIDSQLKRYKKYIYKSVHVSRVRVKYRLLRFYGAQYSLHAVYTLIGIYRLARRSRTSNRKQILRRFSAAVGEMRFRHVQIVILSWECCVSTHGTGLDDGRATHYSINIERRKRPRRRRRVVRPRSLRIICRRRHRRRQKCNNSHRRMLGATNMRLE